MRFFFVPQGFHPDTLRYRGFRHSYLSASTGLRVAARSRVLGTS
ncbi:MAG: hypothetical protein ACK5M7_04625 [Draconibacterium sp.]